MITWFLFDLGNTIIKLDYERFLANVCRDATIGRDELVDLLESPGGYRDLERGMIDFPAFHQFICNRAGYRGDVDQFRTTWVDFFDGLVPGIEEVLDRVRSRYRIAFLSNSNEVHAELFPRMFPSVFRRDDRFIYSYRFKTAKPDQDMYRRALEVVGALPQQAVLVDDLIANVLGARAVGMTAFQFTTAARLVEELEGEGLL